MEININKMVVTRLEQQRYQGANGVVTYFYINPMSMDTFTIDTPECIEINEEERKLCSLTNAITMENKGVKKAEILVEKCMKIFNDILF